MNDERTQFALTCRDGDAPAPVLVGVQAEGRLDAVLFGLTLRQTYRNTSDRVLEVIYTFPLPFQAVLLGFASELNGERQEGVVVAKREAERQYEESLEKGDAPVMLEAHADVEARDDYGRLLAYVRRATDGVLVNETLVREGFARTLFIAPNLALESVLRTAERSARAEGRGLWSACAGADR